MSSKRIDIMVLIFLLGIGSLYSYLTRDLYIGKAVFSGAVFTILPALYLGYRDKKNWRKIIIATLIFGMLFGFFFELIQEFTRSYSVVSQVFPKILGIVPIDNVLGHMMMTFLTLTFYEHFVDRKKSRHISKRVIFALILAGAANVAALLLLRFMPAALITPYPYFFMGICAISFPIFLGMTRPIFIRDMAVSSIYFFFLYLIIEIFAVKLKWWIYPGNNYVGYVSILGISFPFEELFFWMMFYAASLISYYELFIDEE